MCESVFMSETPRSMVLVQSHYERASVPVIQMNLLDFFQFRQLDSNMKLKDEYQHLQFLLSDQSLMLLPEYQQRMEVKDCVLYW